MYRFQIIAHTQPGETIGLVGSSPELGEWDVQRCLRLKTANTPTQSWGEGYPLWWTETELDLHPSLPTTTQGLTTAQVEYRQIEYKYVRLSAQGQVEWEAWGSNRWLPSPAESGNPVPAGPILVDDGAFGYIQPYPFGYRVGQSNSNRLSVVTELTDGAFSGLKIAVVGSSVALGHKAWLLRGWTEMLAETLQQKYGHQVVNVSEVGATVSRTLDRFDAVVTPLQPDVVIVALSLGNEGLAYCRPQERKTVQRRFEHGLHQLLQMIWERGAYPVLAGVYPHGDYGLEHYALLRETQQRMLNWGVPVLNWLDAIDDGQGRWRPDTSFDPAHPNAFGHRLMFEAIDWQIFDLDKSAIKSQASTSGSGFCCFRDRAGFSLRVEPEQQRLQIANPSAHNYTITPEWQALQIALRGAALPSGIYLTSTVQSGDPFLYVDAEGGITTELTIPAETTLEYRSVDHFFSSNPEFSPAKLLFQDRQLSVYYLSVHDQQAPSLWVINESGYDYNLHPMWKELRRALQALPPGVYTDPLQSDAPFRTLMISAEGLESRVKAPRQSAFRLQYQCPLSAIQRVAILPLGDRCAVRMMLHKLEYDGPAFPFDLTRTTQISDVADLVANQFQGMWDPELLDYSPEAGRIYHRKWSGLSFAHEVEPSDRPTEDMTPVYQRMRERYTARSARFRYTLENCDRVLFVRTGIADRPGVIDLVEKLADQCQGKPFQLLLLSPQVSDEFARLPRVVHYNYDFNPDRMYDDLEHWLACSAILRRILDELGISSTNLFWCPPEVRV